MPIVIQTYVVMFQIKMALASFKLFLWFRKLFFEVSSVKILKHQAPMCWLHKTWPFLGLLYCASSQWTALLFTRDFREISLCYLITGHAEIVGSATMPR